MTDELDHYRAGSGEPLVLLHGADESWHSWQPVLEDLARDFEVHALTFPGHLDSPPLDGPVSIAVFADAVEAYLDSVGFPKAHIAGVSLGGMVTVELVRRGRALSGVDFSGPVAFRSEKEVRRLLRLLNLNNAMLSVPGLISLCRRSARIRGRVFALSMAHSERMTTAEFDKLLEGALHGDIAAPYIKSLQFGNRAAPLDPGDVPVCVAWGDKDWLVPLAGYGAPTSELVAGARLVVLTDSGHIPTWDSPAQVVDIIKNTTARAVGRR